MPLIGEVGKVLRDMACRGCESASEAVRKLDYLASRASQQCQILPVRTDPSIVSFDGKFLAKDMLDVLGPFQRTESQNNLSIGITAPNTATHRRATLPALANSPRFVDLSPAEDDFTFDIEDLQWLDAVQ